MGGANGSAAGGPNESVGSNGSLTWTFAKLKFVLLRASLRRRQSVWNRVGTFVALLASLLGAIAGFIATVSLRGGWSAVAEERFLVIGCFLVIFGWWFGPVLSGGSDETVDPMRLALLPLTRAQLRRDQIAAGLVGPAPLMVVVWGIGLVIGTAGPWWTVPFSILAAVVLVLTALIGSRAIATSLAVLNRTRRGGDLATFVAVLGAAMLFVAGQALQFISDEQLDTMTRIARATPLGMIGDAFRLLGDGDVVGALWRIAALGAVAAAAAWCWSRQLDRLMSESDVRGRLEAAATISALPIFDGFRSRLAHTPAGAAVAREIVYLKRSPGRRASMLTSLMLGFAYVAMLAARGQIRDPMIVLVSPLAMVFALQYAANQNGVDPAAFWIEVVAGPQQIARWAGRQALGAVSILTPVLITGVVLAAVSGGWRQFAVMVATMIGATFALVGLGSAMSPAFATPVPDSGNPFGNRQAMQGTGCVAGLVGIMYLVVGAAIVALPEISLWWAVDNRRWGLAALVFIGALAAQLGVWFASSRFAIRSLARNELVVLERLDARLNA